MVRGILWHVIRGHLWWSCDNHSWSTVLPQACGSALPFPHSHSAIYVGAFLSSLLLPGEQKLMALLLAWFLECVGSSLGLDCQLRLAWKNWGTPTGMPIMQRHGQTLLLYGLHTSAPGALQKKGAYTHPWGPVSLISSPTYEGHMGTFVLLCPII